MNDNDLGGFEHLDEIAASYAADPEFRREIADNPREAFAAKGLDLPPEVEIRVWEDTSDTKHIVVPPDPNSLLADEMLGGVAGGAQASTASSAGCTSTASTVPSCLSSAGTVSSVGSARP